jgi:flagellar assembly factor FliW
MSSPSPVDELSDLLVLDLPGGLIGLPSTERFGLTRWGGEGSPFAVLRSLDGDELEFVVVPPSAFFPDYEPVLDDDTAEELELHVADDAVVLVIVTVGDPVDRSTANLLGPIVVNRRTHIARQVVLSPDEFSPRHPLVALTPAR